MFVFSNIIRNNIRVAKLPFGVVVAMLFFVLTGSLYAQDGGQSLEYQTEIRPTSNATVMSCYADDNFAGSEDYRASVWTCGIDTAPFNSIRSYMSFDLSAIPAEATIDSAVLYLFNNPTSTNPANQGLNEAWLSLTTSEWDPFAITWNDRPAVSSNERVDIPLSLNRPLDTVLNMTDLLRYSIESGYETFGLEMKMQRTGFAFISLGFASGSHPDPALHPYLQVSYSGVVSAVESVTSFSGLQISPNPFQSQINLNFYANYSSDLQIELFDLNGRQRFYQRHFQNAGENSISLPMAVNLPTGIYLLRMSDDQGNTVSRRLSHIQ